jgi:O-antigen/teichoic acid export membrane protein
MIAHPSRSFLWAVLESGGLSLLSLAVLLIIARFVGPSELGAFALAFGVVQMLAIVVEMLVHDAIVQRRALTDDHLHTAFWTCLVLGGAMTLGCWFSAPYFAGLFGTPELSQLLGILGCSLVVSGAGCVPIAVLRRDIRFKPLAMRSLYGRLCAAVAALGFAMAGYGIWSLVAQHLIQIGVSTILVWHANPYRPKFRYVPQRLGELLSFGVFSVSSRIVWLSSVRAFTLLVGNFFGLAAAGYLNIAMRVVDTLFDLMAGAADNFALPLFSRRQDDQTSLLRAYSSATEFAVLLTQPAFGGLALCAAPIVAFILGPAWLPAAPLVQILALAAMLQFIVLFAQSTINALGRPGLILSVTLVSLSVFVLAVLVFRPDDVLEATLLWAGRVMVGGPILLVILCRLLDLSAAIVLRAVWLPVGATAVMAAALLATESHLLEGQTAIIKLLVMVPLGAFIYGSIIAVLGRGVLLRLLSFVGAGFRSARTSG